VQRPDAGAARPTRVLAAQLAEFREFFPDNRVEYFVSYYDYYQPEAYIGPATPTSRRTRRSTTRSTGCATRPPPPAHPARRDRGGLGVCIYGLGSPEEYRDQMLHCEVGKRSTSGSLLRRLVDMQYERNDPT
jgi:excinuclease ABC subunit B